MGISKVDAESQLAMASFSPASPLFPVEVFLATVEQERMNKPDSVLIQTAKANMLIDALPEGVIQSFTSVTSWQGFKGVMLKHFQRKPTLSFKVNLVQSLVKGPAEKPSHFALRVRHVAGLLKTLSTCECPPFMIDAEGLARVLFLAGLEKWEADLCIMHGGSEWSLEEMAALLSTDIKPLIDEAEMSPEVTFNVEENSAAVKSTDTLISNNQPYEELITDENLPSIRTYQLDHRLCPVCEKPFHKRSLKRHVLNKHVVSIEGADDLVKRAETYDKRVNKKVKKHHESENNETTNTVMKEVVDESVMESDERQIREAGVKSEGHQGETSIAVIDENCQQEISEESIIADDTLSTKNEALIPKEAVNTMPDCFRLCPKCNKSIHKNSLRRHLIMTHKISVSHAKDLVKVLKIEEKSLNFGTSKIEIEEEDVSFVDESEYLEDVSFTDDHHQAMTIGTKSADYRVCPICETGSQFHKKSLKRHMMNKHLMSDSEANQAIADSRQDPNDVGKIPCDKCHKKLSSQKSLTRHMNNAHPEEQPAGDDGIKVTCKSGKKFKCDETSCGYQTNIERAFINHKLKHRRYDCSLCEMSFPNRRKLKGHIRRKHGDVKKAKKKKSKDVVVKAVERPEWIQWIKDGVVLLEDRTLEGQQETFDR